ncbi:MAG: hypothetical protein IIZ75_11000, partial [Lachnospiraceae bacterium]|nr:hypothetical protein [Lachnospiraceae bacterium]
MDFRAYVVVSSQRVKDVSGSMRRNLQRKITLLFTAESRTCCAITGHNLWLEMGFAHRRRRFLMAKPVTITAQKAV